MTVSNHLFQKVFSTFLLSSTWQGSTSHFLSFSSSTFARFSSLKASMTILSLLFVLFSWFHAFRGYFWTSLFLGFLMIQGLFSEIDHWVLIGYWYIHVWCWLIWSIWGFIKIENSRVYAWIRFGDFVKLSWNWWNWLVVLM